MRLASDIVRRKGYRLPTSQEWEHAIQGRGVSDRFYGDADELLGRYGWFAANSGERTWPVGRLMPNGLGLFDVYGNLREWCHPVSPAQDPQIVRGGSYRDVPGMVSSVHDGPMLKHQKFSTNGFRLAKTVD
jgi:formylglycine-generating enzyme required for sulfatase activity